MKKFAFFTNILDFIFPNYCLICENNVPADKKYVCPDCFNKIPDFDQKHLPVLLKRINHPCFDELFIRFQFDPHFRVLIHHLKYARCTQIAQYFGTALADILPGNYDHIVPIPLHRAKLKERGFNQSLLIAHELSRIMDVSLGDTLLERIHYTKTQTHLNKKERLLNVAGAFQLVGEVQGKKILLIDDVITTGATLNTCAAVLKNGGAGVVDLAAVATPTTLLQEQLERDINGDLVSLQKSG